MKIGRLGCVFWPNLIEKVDLPKVLNNVEGSD